jgi:hypothetical protein
VYINRNSTDNAKHKIGIMNQPLSQILREFLYHGDEADILKASLKYRFVIVGHEWVIHTFMFQEVHHVS